MPLINKPGTKYHSIEEMIQKSACVIRRVFLDKTWCCINNIVENRNYYDVYPSEDRFDYRNGCHYTDDVVEDWYPDRPKSNGLTNPFLFPNTYIEEFFNESIDYTNLQSPIFKMRKGFLQKISIRRNYQEIIDKLINDLNNDGTNNKYVYAISVLYFLLICHHWNLVQNRVSPDRFTDHDIWYTNRINEASLTVATMAVNKALEICEIESQTRQTIGDCFQRNEFYDLDDVFEEEMVILDCTISDVLWQMHIGTEVVPLEGGLQDGAYEYFEDDDNISPNGDINNGTSYQQPKQQNYSFVW